MHFPAHDQRDHGNKEHGDNCHQRQTDVNVTQHLINGGQTNGQAVQTHHNGHGKDHTHRFDVVGHIGHHLAGLVLLEIGGGHGLQMGIQIIAHIPLDLTGCTKNTMTPDVTAQKHSGCNKQHAADLTPNGTFHKDTFLDAIDHAAHDDGHFGLQHVDIDQRCHTQQIAPLILFDKAAGIFAAKNSGNSCFFLFFHRIPSFLSPSSTFLPILILSIRKYSTR